MFLKQIGRHVTKPLKICAYSKIVLQHILPDKLLGTETAQVGQDMPRLGKVSLLYDQIPVYIVSLPNSF